MRAIRLLVAICAIATIATAANAQGIDWQKVDAALGRSATVGGDVHRYGFPRTDLQVTVDGVAIRPSFALGGWAAFKPMGDRKSTRLNSSHSQISYAVFCLKKKKNK